MCLSLLTAETNTWTMLFHKVLHTSACDLSCTMYLLFIDFLCLLSATLQTAQITNAVYHIKEQCMKIYKTALLNAQF